MNKKTIFEFFNLPRNTMKKYLEGKHFIFSINSANSSLLNNLCEEILVNNSEVVEKYNFPIKHRNMSLINYVTNTGRLFNKMRGSSYPIIIIANPTNNLSTEFIDSEIIQTELLRCENKLQSYNFLYEKEDLSITVEKFNDKTYELILTTMCSFIENVTQCLLAESILSAAKNFFGSNLKLFLWAGSCGKGKFIENWSDIDIYLYLSEIPHEQIMYFTNQFNHLNIHIDSTFYTMNELKTLSLCERAIVTIYEAQNKKDTILYKDSDIFIPVIKKRMLKRYNKEELFRAANELKRQLYVSVNNPTKNDKRFPDKCDMDENNSCFNISRIIKAENFLKKLILREKNIFTSYANEVDYAFAKCCLKNHLLINYDIKEFVKLFCTYDGTFLIRNKQISKYSDIIIKQGFAILKMFDSFKIRKQ